jgi:hypothetical protein
MLPILALKGIRLGMEQNPGGTAMEYDRRGWNNLWKCHSSDPLGIELS